MLAYPGIRLARSGQAVPACPSIDRWANSIDLERHVFRQVEHDFKVRVGIRIEPHRGSTATASSVVDTSTADRPAVAVDDAERHRNPPSVLINRNAPATVRERHVDVCIRTAPYQATALQNLSRNRHCCNLACLNNQLREVDTGCRDHPFSAVLALLDGTVADDSVGARSQRPRFAGLPFLVPRKSNLPLMCVAQNNRALTDRRLHSGLTACCLLLDESRIVVPVRCQIRCERPTDALWSAGSRCSSDAIDPRLVRLELRIRSHVARRARRFKHLCDVLVLVLDSRAAWHCDGSAD